MVVEKEVVHTRVASAVGVLSVPPAKPRLPPQERTAHAPRMPEWALPEVKNIRTTELRCDFARVEWEAVPAGDVAYKIWLEGVAKGTAVKEPRIELSGLKPGKRYKIEIRTQPRSKMSRQGPSKKVTYYFTTPQVETTALVTPPVSPPRPEVVSSVRPQITVVRPPLPISKPKKRKVSARAEELMKKRAFPKAVKEAIEKGLERKEAPRNIERIIEKVAKTNEPNYILRRTIAKRLARGGIVQYKVDTDKGTIIYENADEKDANAILGMPTPTGEVIPLQIKVIR